MAFDGPDGPSLVDHQRNIYVLLLLPALMPHGGVLTDLIMGGGIMA